MELLCAGCSHAVFFASSEAAVSSQRPVALSVGMIALLANPQNYDGKVIQTIGVLCIEHEGDAIYFHDEDARHINDKSALSLRLSDDQREQFKSLHLKYVLIEGTMYANGPESSRFGGAMGNITRLEAWGPTTGVDGPPAKSKPRPGR